LVSMPHVGTELPAALVPRLEVAALQLVDTDWRINELYNFLEAPDVSVIVPRYSRYVVDLNRPPDGSNLYPGKTSSGICPLQSFAGSDLYRPAENPGPAEVQQRLEDYWHPYHRALSAELERLKREGVI
jgi:N-formylglutamate deformylase